MAVIRPFPQQAPRVEIGRPWSPTRVSEIIDLPPAPQWVWDARIMRGQVTILGGESKVGKSLLLQQLLSCAAMGLPSLGRHTERVRCFGYFCEDTDAWLRTRQFDINAAIGCEMPDYDDRLHWYSPAATDDCLLVDFEYGKIKELGAWGRLWREIDELEAELIAIDTAATVFGGNELNRRQVTAFMRKLQQKAIEGDRAIILAAHPPTGNVGKGYAGSGAWLASARAGLTLERPQGYDPVTDTPRFERVLRGLGANYSAGRSLDRMRWAHGVFVCEEPEAPPARTDTTGAREVMDREMIYGLIRTRNNGGKVSADWQHPTSMQRRYRATFDRRTALNDLNASADRLFASHQAVRVRVGGEVLVRQANAGFYAGEEPWTV